MAESSSQSPAARDAEAARAIGRYRSPMFVLIPTTIILLAFLTFRIVAISRHHFQIGDLFSLIFVCVLLTAVWLIPQTIVSTTGLRLVWRFRFFPWSQVARVYGSGPGDPDLRIGLVDGEQLSVPGLPSDRVAGILILARRT